MYVLGIMNDDALVSGGRLGYSPRAEGAAHHIVQCMGGWCGSREKCRHYDALGVIGRQPVERLCGPDDEPLTMRGAHAAQS